MTRDTVGAAVPSSHSSHGHAGLGLVLAELLGALACVLLVFKLFQYVVFSSRANFRKKVAPVYVAMEAGLDPAKCIAVDCTARKGMPTLTHHKVGARQTYL